MAWSLPTPHEYPNSYEFRILISNANTFLEEDIIERRVLPGTTTSLTWVIENAWDTLGRGKKYLRLSACNSANICSGPYTNSIRLEERFQFTPDPMTPGQVSKIWDIPERQLFEELTEIFLNVEITGTRGALEPGDGHIKVERLDFEDWAQETHLVHSETDTSTLPISPREKRIRITVEPRAVAETQSTTNLTLHWGNSANGIVLARASISLPPRPATPAVGTNPWTLDPATDTLTLSSWQTGTQPAGANPDHYKITIPEFDHPFITNGTTLTIRDIQEELAAGTHSAQVQHCNTEGGCSRPLQISFTLPTGPPKIRIRGLEEEVSIYDGQHGAFEWDTFKLEAFNLVKGNRYTITASAPAESGLSISNRCRTREPFSTTFTASRTYHSEQAELIPCREPGGTITAELLDAGTASLDTYETPVIVRHPRMTILGLDQELNIGNPLDITFNLSGLVTQREYRLRIWVESTGQKIGFADTCPSYREFIQRGASQHNIELTLHACGDLGDTATIYAGIWEYPSEPDARIIYSESEIDSEQVKLTVGPPSPLVITGPNPEMEIQEDQPHNVTVTGSGLDPTASYTITGNTGYSIYGFSEPDHEETPSLGFSDTCTNSEARSLATGSTNLSETFTVYGCKKTKTHLAFTLDGDNGDVESSIIEIRVTSAPLEPSIQLQNLPAEIENGDSAAFMVEATNLTAGTSYDLKLTAPTTSNLKFGAACPGNQEQTQTFTPTGTSQSASFTVHACGPDGGVITAELLETGGATALATITQQVTVKTPSIHFLNPSMELVDMGTTDITVVAANMVASKRYFVRVTTGSPQIGFATPCLGNGEKYLNVTARTDSDPDSENFTVTVHACGATTGTMTAQLYHGQVDILNPALPPGAMPIAEATLQTETELTLEFSSASANLELGQTLITTLSGRGLDPSVIYTLELSTSTPRAGFDAACGPKAPEILPAGAATLSRNITVHPCLLGTAALQATLTGSDGDSATASVDLTVVNPLPTAPQDLKSTAGDGEIRLDWTSNPYDHGYEVQQLDGLDWKALPFGAFTITNRGSQATVTGLTNGITYEHRVRSLNQPTGTAGEIFRHSPWTSAHSTTPVLLDIIPEALRKALLTWTAVPGADEYRVMIQNPQAPSDPWHMETVTSSAPGYTIELDSVLKDSVLNNRGLAHEDEFRMRVDAVNTGGTVINESIPIRITDNPLLITGGRAYAPSTSGTEAGLAWTTETGATDYEIRYRQLGFRTGFLQGTQDHSNQDWPNSEKWPYYHEESTGSQDSPGTKSLTRLNSGEIYGVRINYTKSQERTFSARDAFVWPSKAPPSSGEKVATYPFFGYHENREFKYIICASDFPSTHLPTWRKLIPEALGKWEEATREFVRTTRQIRNCAHGPLANFIISDDEKNEIRMLDLATQPGSTNAEKLLAFPEAKSDALKVCITMAPACVTSWSGYTGLPTQDQNTRARISELLQKAIDDTINYTEYVELYGWIVKARGNEASAGTQLGGVDITFRASSFTTEPKIPSKTEFNTCLPDNDIDDMDPDDGYFAYSTMVHEGGHALGMSGIDYSIFKTPFEEAGRKVLGIKTDRKTAYETAHPTIPDSILNYDPYMDQGVRNPIFQADTDGEPDCSPHPLDILAIYAIYQKVPR